MVQRFGKTQARRLERRVVLLGEGVPLGVFARRVGTDDVEEPVSRVVGQAPEADPAEVKGVEGGGDRQGTKPWQAGQIRGSSAGANVELKVADRARRGRNGSRSRPLP